MKRLAATLALLSTVVWLPPPQAAASVSARVEPQVIDELDTARLIVRVTGTSQAQRLDLDALEDDFDVLTTQSSSQYRSVNGSVQAMVEYQVLLRPRRAGSLTIPPIALEGDTTGPLELTVRGIDPALRRAIDRMVFFETEVTDNPVYVQSQTVLVRRLFYASGAQIYSDLPGIPQVDDAVVMPLGETTSSSTVRDGRRYGVIEQRFAIFPEKSGTLTIPAIAVTSSVRLEVGGRTRRSGIRVATDPVSLTVRPIPLEYPAGQPWLPARNLTLDDRWDPAGTRLEVGDQVGRTVTARVDGNVSSAIPPLESRVPDDHFRRYPEPPQLDDQTTSTMVRGVREETYAIVPTAPGAVTIPGTSITWWDVTSHRVRTASTPPRTLQITGTPVRRTLEDPDAGTAGTGTSQPAAAGPEPDGDAGLKPLSVRAHPWPWSWLILAGVVTAALLAWLRWHRRTGTRQRIRGTRRALRIACRGGNPAAIHRALLDHLSAHYATGSADAVRRFRDDGHGAVLDRLNAALYRDAGETTPAGNDVLEAVDSLPGRRRRPVDDPLPALYEV